MSGDFGFPNHVQGCPHLADLDGEEEKESMLKRYKTVISWHMVRRNEAVHPAKRRKVSSDCGSLERCGTDLMADCIAVVRTVPADAVEALCMPPVLLHCLLEGVAHPRTSPRCRT